jgi:hypothetical protein
MLQVAIFHNLRYLANREKVREITDLKSSGIAEAYIAKFHFRYSAFVAKRGKSRELLKYR